VADEGGSYPGILNFQFQIASLLKAF